MPNDICERGYKTIERRYSTYVITEALRYCGVKMGKTTLADAHRQTGRFTAKRITVFGKPTLAATAKDVQAYLIITGRGSAPLWLITGLLDQAAAHVIAWTERAKRVQEAIDKEFNYEQDE